MSAQFSRITVADDTVYPRTFVLPAVGVELLERGRVALTVIVEAQECKKNLHALCATHSLIRIKPVRRIRADCQKKQSLGGRHLNLYEFFMRGHLS